MTSARGSSSQWKSTNLWQDLVQLQPVCSHHWDPLGGGHGEKSWICQPWAGEWETESQGVAPEKLAAGLGLAANSATLLLKEGGIREAAQQEAIKEPKRRSRWLWPRKEGSCVSCDKATRALIHRWWVCSCWGWPKHHLRHWRCATLQQRIGQWLSRPLSTTSQTSSTPSHLRVEK